MTICMGFVMPWYLSSEQSSNYSQQWPRLGALKVGYAKAGQAKKNQSASCSLACSSRFFFLELSISDAKPLRATAMPLNPTTKYVPLQPRRWVRVTGMPLIISKLQGALTDVGDSSHLTHLSLLPETPAYRSNSSLGNAQKPR